jgi:hypothetical protein
VSKSPPDKDSAKLWVLDTETKGTGAQVVPLDGRRAVEGRSAVVVEKPKPKPPEAPKPKLPRKFKVVDVMSKRVLAEGADARTTVDLLEGVRSIVDVSIYVWEESAAKWQGLTQREAHMLWDLRGRR